MTAEEYNQSVDEHADGIYRFILKNIRDEDKANDVVQDTFEKLWRKVDTVTYSKVKSYLFTTAYHTMIDRLRKDKRETGMDGVEKTSWAHTEQYSDLKEILNEAISRLPDDQRSVILLRDYEGYAYNEISEITGLSESQVKVYIYRGRLFLKNYIGNPEQVV
ncbi:MAG TPA: RNA polymerase sigma factor [Bacteroidales bacterium]|nr:RNA polymerase sigma factor [Bacteroidales bacterium]